MNTVKRRQIAVIGLGKFGLKLAQTLMSMGHEVLGIDHDEEKIRASQKELTQVIQANATNKTALEQIRICDFEHVLISVGDSIAASAMIAMYLKELKVSRIWAKAVHKDHEKLLVKIGVDEVIIPEFMAADHLAGRITIPGFIEHLQIDSSIAVREYVILKWHGQSLREIDVTNRNSLQIIAIKKKNQNHFLYVPKADDVLLQGDRIIVIGSLEQLVKLDP